MFIRLLKKIPFVLVAFGLMATLNPAIASATGNGGVCGYENRVDTGVMIIGDDPITIGNIIVPEGYVATAFHSRTVNNVGAVPNPYHNTTKTVDRIGSFEAEREGQGADFSQTITPQTPAPAGSYPVTISSTDGYSARFKAWADCVPVPPKTLSIQGAIDCTWDEVNYAEVYTLSAVITNPHDLSYGEFTPALGPIQNTDLVLELPYEGTIAKSQVATDQVAAHQGGCTPNPLGITISGTIACVADGYNERYEFTGNISAPEGVIVGTPNVPNGLVPNEAFTYEVPFKDVNGVDDVASFNVAPAASGCAEERPPVYNFECVSDLVIAETTAVAQFTAMVHLDEGLTLSNEQWMVDNVVETAGVSDDMLTLSIVKADFAEGNHDVVFRATVSNAEGTVGAISCSGSFTAPATPADDTPPPPIKRQGDLAEDMEAASQAVAEGSNILGVLMSLLFASVLYRVFSPMWRTLRRT